MRSCAFRLGHPELRRDVCRPVRQNGSAIFRNVHFDSPALPSSVPRIVADLTMTVAPSLQLAAVSHAVSASPGEVTAATELARLTGAKSGGDAAWMWLRSGDDGAGEVIATHGAFLFAAVRLLANGVGDLTRAKLA